MKIYLFFCYFWVLIVVFVLLFIVQVDFVFKDDIGQEVCFKVLVKCIVIFVLYVVESLYVVGVGDKLVGIVDYSDYLLEVKKVLCVGGYLCIDLEVVVVFKLDFVFVWESGNNMMQVDKFKVLGLIVYVL